MQKTTPLEKYREAAARLNTYVTGTMPVLDAGRWEVQEVHLGFDGGPDHIVAHQHDDGGFEYRLTLTPNIYGSSSVVTREGEEELLKSLRGNHAPGVPVPTADEAIGKYLDAFGIAEQGDE